MRETCVEFISGHAYLTWYTGEQRFINQIKKLHAAYPDDVEIVAENTDGSVMAHVPESWFRPPRPRAKRRSMTCEERLAASARLQEARNKKSSMN